MARPVLRSLQCATALLLVSQLSDAAVISGNIHADLTDLSGSGLEGVYTGIGMYAYEDTDPIVGNRRELTSFVWDGAQIDFDLGVLPGSAVITAQAVFDGVNFVGLDVDINDGTGSGDALLLNPDGSIGYWSNSEGPNGAGVYATGSKDADVRGYNVDAILDDFTDTYTGLHPGIAMFSYDANTIVNSKAELQSFMWDGAGIDFDIDVLDPRGIVRA